MVADVIKNLEAAFTKAIDNYKKELGKVRTGRANVAMLDGVKVDYYGTPTPLSQVGTLNVPDPRMITVKPWEKSVLPAIEKAIKQRPELGLNPMVDGDLVRVPIPALTQERRKELVKLIKGMNEEAKVTVRNARRDGNEGLKKLKSDGKITEDDEKKGLKQIQDLTDKSVSQIDDIGAKKEKEILEG